MKKILPLVAVLLAAPVIVFAQGTTPDEASAEADQAAQAAQQQAKQLDARNCAALDSGRAQLEARKQELQAQQTAAKDQAGRAAAANKAALAQAQSSARAQADALRKQAEQFRFQADKGSFLPAQWEALAETRVNLDVHDVPVRDALKQVLDQARFDYVVDDDVPAEARIPYVHVDNIRLSTALDLITQAAGVHWRYELRDGKRTIRVGKSISANLWINPVTLAGPNAISGAFADGLKLTLPNNPLAVPFARTITEERSSFTCPHCKGTVTMIRRREQPTCPKCGRLFQADWQFCPADGTKRPAAPNDWQYCPLCGKKIAIDKAAVPSSKIPVLGDLPVIGRLFQTTPAGSAGGADPQE